MSANVSITTASAPNVVAIPAIALLGTTGNYSVRTVTDGQEIQTVPVEVGLVTSTLAEITSGIDAGTAVVVGTSSTRTGSSTTTGGFGGGGFGGNFPGGGTFVRGVGR
jgi:multidrug efflux pump subunit AcrA (membrane-fusion protein)